MAAACFASFAILAGGLAALYGLDWYKNMYVLCDSCNKEFNDLAEGVRYSSSIKGLLWFCSDDCCKNYLNVNKAAK